MNNESELQETALKLAEEGPAIALDEPSLDVLRSIVEDDSVIACVAERVGSTSRAEQWLASLMDRALAAREDPDADHSQLVGSLGALGALVAEQRPEQATISFEAVAL